MSTVLCVIDMQTSFKATEKALEGVLHQIRLAKRRKAPIIVLEYEGEPPTHPYIMRALKGIKNVKFRTKDEDDRSPEVLTVLKRIKYKKVRITGVNGCFCVYETARGIKYANVPFEIQKNAISCICRKRKCHVEHLIEASPK